METRGRSLSKRVTIPVKGASTVNAVSAARATRTTSRPATDRGRSMTRRVKAMKAVSKGRAAAGAGTATATVAVAAAPSDPLYVYWTVDIESSSRQRVYVAPLANSEDLTVTSLKRTDLKKAILDSATYCGTNINEEYLKAQQSKSKNPMIFILSRFLISSGDTLMPESLGFILSREEEEGTGVYLDVICTAPGFGRLFLDFFHDFVFSDPTHEYIKLSSLANVLTLYPKFGYEFRRTCHGAPLATLSTKLTERVATKVPPPPNTTAAYADSDYLDFMYDTLYKTADLGVREAEDCKKLVPFISRRQFIKSDCAQDGFTMIKCRSTMEKAGKAGTLKARKYGSRRSTPQNKRLF